MVNSGNDRLRRGNRAVGAQDDDRATYAEFEKRLVIGTTLKKIGRKINISAIDLILKRFNISSE